MSESEHRQLREQYAAATARAREARDRLDALLLDAADDDLIAAAEAAADAAEGERDQLGVRLRAAPPTGAGGRLPSPSARPTRPRRTPDPTASRTQEAAEEAMAPVVHLGTGVGKTEQVVAIQQRDLVGETLTYLGAPLRGPELAAHVSLRTGRSLSAAQLTQMRREDRRQHEVGGRRPERRRPWYIVPCLSAETLLAATGTYSMSNWPVADRMISPWAPRLWVAHAASNIAAELLAAGVEAFTIGDSTPRRAAAAPNVPWANLQAILTRLLRGNEWGRTGAQVDVTAVGADARAEAATLSNLHTAHVADAVARLNALAATAPDIVLWGLERPEEVRTPGSPA